MTGNKVSLVNQVCRFDRFLTKTKVRHGHTTGFLGVIIKICLSIHISVITDDLDGVLVSSNSTVSTQSPELAVDGSFRSGYQRSTGLKRQMCNIVYDTDSKFSLLSVVVYSNDLSRSGIFGSQSVTACEYRSIIEFGSFKSCNNIKVQRLAKSTWLFGSVKYGDQFSSFRNSLYQCICAERSIKTNFNNTDFLACSTQIINCLLDGITYRSHSDDNFLSIRSSVVVEQLVIGTDLSVNFVHVLLNDCRKSIVVRVACLTSLEEDIRVLSRTSLTRMIRIQSIFSVCFDCIHIYHIFQIFVIPLLDLLDLMRSTESVEEVDERKTSFDCCTVSNRSQVHNLLYAGLAEHCYTSLTTGIYIGVISKDRQCMACQCTSGYVEYTRKSLTCYFVQVRDHQKKSLRSGKGGCQSTSCQRSVYSTCCTSLGLHLGYLYGMSEDVGSSLSCPFISSFCHNR